MERGLIATIGKTPWKTMDAALYASNRGGGPVVKLAQPGPTRAARGSVRWTLRVL